MIRTLLYTKLIFVNFSFLSCNKIEENPLTNQIYVDTLYLSGNNSVERYHLDSCIFYSNELNRDTIKEVKFGNRKVEIKSVTVSYDSLLNQTFKKVIFNDLFNRFDFKKGLEKSFLELEGEVFNPYESKELLRFILFKTARISVKEGEKTSRAVIFSPQNIILNESFIEL